MAGLAQLALDVGNAKKAGSNPDDIADIIEFVESDWGLQGRLYPVQRIILKAHYGIALDDNPFDFDLSKPVPRDHPYYDPDSVDTKGFYRWRVPLSDFRKESWTVMSEADYLRYLYDKGRCNIREVIPGDERREMILAVGRRSGKTFLAACIAAYETYKLIKKGSPHKYYEISESNPIQIISVATDKDQAGLLYNDVSGHFKKCTFFDQYTANNTQSFARFQTPGDIEDSCRYEEDPRAAKVSLKVTFRSCIAKGLRGAGNMVIILDELAHFTNNSSQSSAEEVYKAISPSKSAFAPKDEWGMPTGPVESRIISISSPMGRSGYFYELFQFALAGGEGAKNMLAIRAPSWEVNLGIEGDELRKEFAKDANSFWTEYGAEFTDRTRGWFEDESYLLACVDPNRRPAVRAAPRKPHFMGIDFGLTNDATAVAIGHIEVFSGVQKVVVDLVDQKIVGQGDYADVTRLDFEEMADWILDLSKRFYIVEGMFDQYAGAIFEQCMEKRGLRQFKSHRLMRGHNSEIFKNFKDLVFEEKIVLYNWPLPADSKEPTPKCPYIAELMTLQEESVSKNIVVVQAPQTKGFHDDMSDALVRMAYLATEARSNAGYIAGSGMQTGVPISPGQRAQMRKDMMAVRRRARQSGSHPSRMIPRGRGY